MQGQPPYALIVERLPFGVGVWEATGEDVVQVYANERAGEVDVDLDLIRRCCERQERHHLGHVHIEPLGERRALVVHETSERRQREERMRFEAEHDHLTGLANRRAFERALEETITGGEGAGLVLVDLDGLKQLNDRYGHLYGDSVLRSVGRRLRAISREEDMIARFGGDEFVALLPDLSHPREAAEAFRERALEALALASVEASAGVAAFPEDGRDMLALLGVADRSMYLEKRAS